MNGRKVHSNSHPLGPVIWTATVTFLLVMGMAMLPPAIGVLSRHYDLPLGSIALLLSVFAGGRLLFSVPGGILADLIGFRKVAVIGCCITVISAGLSSLLPSFYVLVVLQLIQGMGSALYTTGALAAILTAAPTERVGRITALYQGVVIAGMSLAPAIGGFAVHYYGIRGPFLVYFVASIVSLVITLIKLDPEVSPGRAIRDTTVTPTKSLASTGEEASVEFQRSQFFRHRAFPIAMLSSFASFWIVAGVRNTLVPVHAEMMFEFSPVEVGWILSASSAATVVLLGHAGSAIDRSRKPVLVFSLSGMGAATLLLAMSTQTWSFVSMVLLLGVAQAYAGAVPVTIMIDAAGSKIRGTAIGVQRLATGFGLTLGPVSVGLLLGVMSYRTILLVVGIAVVVLGVAARWMPETKP